MTDATPSSTADRTTAAMEPRAKDSTLVRAVPGLVVAAGLIALAAALVIATRSGVNPKDSKTVTIGPFDLVLVYTTPSLLMVVAGVLTALALFLLVNGVDAWAARRVTKPARQAHQAIERPLRSEVTAARPSGPLSVTALIPAHNEELRLGATLLSLQH